MTTFTDDFNRADGAPGANWVLVSGTTSWTIISQQLSSGSAGGTIIIRAATAMATNDHSAQVKIAATSSVSHGVWCRGNATLTSGYLWRNDGTSWNLFSVVGGSFTSIGSFAGAAVAGDVAKVQAVGTTIKGFVNGIQRVSVTDTNVPTGTSVGLRAESVAALRFDDFTATDVTSGVSGDAALAGAATLTATGLRTAASGTTLTATANLTAAGTRTTPGTAGLAGVALLAATGSVTTSSGGALAATAAIAADGQVTVTGNASLTALADLAAVGQVEHPGQAGLAATVAVDAQGQVDRRGAAAVAGVAALTAAGAVIAAPIGGDAVLAATAVLTASGATTVRGGAGLAATVTLTASGATTGSHDDVEVTVGRPHGSPWSAGPPHASAWKVGPPC
ncbi:hypothetical protein [Streptomyces sp. SGAir0957]